MSILGFFSQLAFFVNDCMNYMILYTSGDAYLCGIDDIKEGISAFNDSVVFVRIKVFYSDFVLHCRVPLPNPKLLIYFDSVLFVCVVFDG